jgi:hypothetical protein
MLTYYSWNVLTKGVSLLLFEYIGQKDKGRASPSSVSPSKLPKFHTALPVSNGDVPVDSIDGFESGPVGPLSGFQEEELCVEGT